MNLKNEHIKKSLIPLENKYRNLFFAFFGFGLLVFIATLIFGNEEYQKRAWGSLLFNSFFFYSLGLGGSILISIYNILNIKWLNPIKFIAESFSCFIPFTTIIFVFFLLAIKFDIASADQVYVWIKDPSILDHYWGKNFWLQENFMLIRDFFALIFIAFLSYWQFKTSRQMDIDFVKNDILPSGKSIKKNKNKLSYFSPVILIVYAIFLSLIGFDLLMSISPKWFSTLWGGLILSMAFQILFASFLIKMFIVKNTYIGNFYSKKHFLDIGNLFYGFSIFFAYLVYSHILTYWYGNVPEETEYFLHRMHGPWFYIIIMITFFSFLIPLFLMIPKASKYTMLIAVPLAVVALIGQWLSFLIFVIPDMVHDYVYFVPTIEISLFLFIFGLFGLSLSIFYSRVPAFSLSDEDMLGNDN